VSSLSIFTHGLLAEHVEKLTQGRIVEKDLRRYLAGKTDMKTTETI